MSDPTGSTDAFMTPEALWAEFLASGSPCAADAAGSTYETWHFGNSAEMADELLGLVLAGPKRATAGALWSYELDGDPIPAAGGYSVVTDGEGRARAVLRTVSAEVVPFDQVTPEFAAAEGEGDLSLEYWRDGHWRYFTAELVPHGIEPTTDMPVVCERFEVVYPAA